MHLCLSDPDVHIIHIDLSQETIYTHGRSRCPALSWPCSSVSSSSLGLRRRRSNAKQSEASPEEPIHHLREASWHLGVLMYIHVYTMHIF